MKWQVFEEFVAAYHALKRNALMILRKHSGLNLGPDVSLSDFYNGAVMTSGLQDMTISIPDEKSTVLYHSGAPIPENGVRVKGADGQEQSAVKAMQQGSVVVNSPGAAVDVMAIDRFAVRGQKGGEVLQLFAVAHTEKEPGKSTLDEDKVTEDRKNALAVWDPHKNKKFDTTEAADVRKMRRVMVHVTNREFHPELQKILEVDPLKSFPDSVFIGIDQLVPVYGALFGSRVRHHAYNPTGCKRFSTSSGGGRGPAARLLPGGRRLHKGGRGAGFVLNMLRKCFR
jgi:hypothetical protein